ncbi:NUDIX domain-containing protein [Candidatus Shapirobacteria bacterium]|nr:NUDIX domain-containing protein [Candidatus Shapirobacteria bacterium]
MQKAGVKAFIIYEKKLLLILRDNKPNIPSPNKWGLPGGAIEKNESILKAIKRELKEEISIVPKKIIYLGKQTYEEGSEVFRYFSKLTKNEFQNVKLGSEGQKLEFFRLNEVNKLDLAGYSTEYFLNYFDQIREFVEKDKIPDKKLLGLV